MPTSAMGQRRTVDRRLAGVAPGFCLSDRAGITHSIRQDDLLREFFLASLELGDANTGRDLLPPFILAIPLDDMNAGIDWTICETSHAASSNIVDLKLHEYAPLEPKLKARHGRRGVRSAGGQKRSQDCLRLFRSASFAGRSIQQRDREIQVDWLKGFLACRSDVAVAERRQLGGGDNPSLAPRTPLLGGKLTAR